MKNTLLFFVLLLSSQHSTWSQSGIYWSEPMPVAESSFGDDSPKMQVLADGSPVTIWGKTDKIYFSRWENGSFTEPVQLNTNGIPPDIYGFGGLGLATWHDRVFVVFESFGNGIHLLRSEDGGQNWELPVEVFNPPVGEWATLPSVATDDNGNPLVSVLRELANETNARYVMMHSTDGGMTFSDPIVASDPAPGEYVCECCPSTIFSRGNDVWLAFRNNDDNLRDAWVSRSSDGGTTFDVATDVDATDWMINSCPISDIKLSPLVGDSLISAWMSGASGVARVSISTLHGGTMEKGWEVEMPQTNMDASQVRPAIAGQNDTIGLVWEENGFGINGIDLMFAFSKNGAAGLTSNFINLTDLVGGQRYPDLVYHDGTFHLVYTHASGEVTYQKGTVSEISSNFDPKHSMLKMELAAQPVRGRMIQVRLPEGLSDSMTFTLHSTGGMLLQSWQEQVYQGGMLELAMGDIPTGVYFLRAEHSTGSWSGKVVVTP